MKQRSAKPRPDVPGGRRRRESNVLRLIEWLLDLQNIRLGRDAPLLLRWERSIPAWALFAGALLVLAWIVWVYRRERTTTARRLCLAALRGGVIALVAAVLCRPSLVLQRNRIETSHIALLVDTSQSMAAREREPDADTPPDSNLTTPMQPVPLATLPSRLERIQKGMLDDDAAALRKLLLHNGVQLYAFSASVEPVGAAGGSQSLGTLVQAVNDLRAEGVSTDLARAVQQVIEKTQGRRLAAIVLASDGRATQPGNLKDALDLAAGRQVPIYPLRVGSPEPIRDLEVGPLSAQDGVFVNDILAIEAQLTSRGLTEPTSVRVDLLDDRNGGLVATENVVLDPTTGSTRVELRTKAARGGVARYRVEARALPGEQNVENNVDRIDATVLEGGLRVLFVEGYPRYEYRYLKNALLREATIQVSALLLEADEQFIQEGAEPIRRFPDTPEELGRFDVVLFGDVDPRSGWLTAAQMNMLLDFVGNEGGGFGLIAGERGAPHRFRGTPLERLIPVSVDPGFVGRYDAPLTGGFQPRLTADGRRSRVLRFAADRETNAALFETLPEWYWFARTLGPKPGASVLLEHPTARTATGPMPLTVTGRYGAGRLFFQASDESWRWRRHTGELLHDSYWVHVARELMRDRRGASDRRYILRTDRRTYAYGGAVRAQIEVLDPQLLNQHPEQIELTLSERAGSGAEPAVARFDAARISPQSNIFEAAYVPPRPGGYAVEASGVARVSTEHATSVLIRVDRPDLEGRRPEADHETLERIAAATGGRVLELDQLAEGFAAIRDRSVQIPDDLVEPLWDSKLVLAIFALMISLEWGLRKAFGLV